MTDADFLLCGDCPPVGYPTDETRCDECPRITRLREAGVRNEKFVRVLDEDFADEIHLRVGDDLNFLDIWPKGSGASLSVADVRKLIALLSSTLPQVEPTAPRLETDDVLFACCDTFVRESASNFCATCGYTNLDHLRKRSAVKSPALHDPLDPCDVPRQ